MNQQSGGIIHEVLFINWVNRLQDCICCLPLLSFDTRCGEICHVKNLKYYNSLLTEINGA